MSIASDGNAAIIDPLKELVAYFGPLLGERGLAAAGLTPDEMAPVQETFKREGLREATKLVTPRMLSLAIHGSPDECISKLELLERAGVNHVLIGAPLGPDPKVSINIIGREIIPHFKNR
jgi:5,10-methylenetetrahydromethanopterin reductase